MAVPTELYIVYPDYGDDEERFIAPALITSDLEILQMGVEALQEAATHTQFTFKVIKVTEAESVFKVTPEKLFEDEEVDEDLLTQIGNIINNTKDVSF